MGSKGKGDGVKVGRNHFLRNGNKSFIEGAAAPGLFRRRGNLNGNHHRCLEYLRVFHYTLHPPPSDPWCYGTWYIFEQHTGFSLPDSPGSSGKIIAPIHTPRCMAHLMHEFHLSVPLQLVTSLQLSTQSEELFVFNNFIQDSLASINLSL